MFYSYGEFLKTTLQSQNIQSSSPSAQASRRSKSRCQGFKHPNLKANVKSQSIQVSRVQAFRVQASRVQASRNPDSTYPEPKRPEPRHPDHASRVQLLWYAKYSGQEMQKILERNLNFKI